MKMTVRRNVQVHVILVNGDNRDIVSLLSCLDVRNTITITIIYIYCKGVGLLISQLF